MTKTKVCVVILPLVMLLSCNRAFEKAMKSTNKEMIIKLAEDYNRKGNYRQTSELLRHVTPLVIGTKLSQKVLYMAAQNSFDDKNYLLSATRFKKFAENNPSDSLSEKAMFMSAKSYYLNAPAYNLDQSQTNEAIGVIQSYINRYPDSKNLTEANKYIIELRSRLEKKAYENALYYYKTGVYDAAVVALQSFIEDYPDTKYKEDAYINLLRSRHEVALNSVLKKKYARLLEANTVYKQLFRLYPDSKYLKEAKKLNNDILESLKVYNN